MHRKRKKPCDPLARARRRRYGRVGGKIGDAVGGFLDAFSDHAVNIVARQAGKACSGIAGAFRRLRKKGAAAKAAAPRSARYVESVVSKPLFSPVDPREIAKVRFSDVVGLDDAKAAITERVITPVKYQEKAKALGIMECGGSILLVGPGGNGKSLLAKAAANEVGMTVIEVTTSDIIRRSQQESLERVVALFGVIAQYPRVLIIINEAEGVFRDTESPIMQAVNAEFLTRSSGLITGGNSHVLMMLGTSNRPEMFRPEMRRTGRFSVIFVGLPDLGGRRRLFEKAMGNTPSDGIDYDVLANRTRLASCADIADRRDGLVTRAKRQTLDRSKALPDNQEVFPVEMRDFDALLSKFRPSIGENELRRWYPDGMESLT